MAQTPTLTQTRQKVERFFNPEALQRIGQAGLMIIDKNDFTAMMQVYEDYKNENDGLRDQVKSLHAEIARLRERVQVRLL